MTQLHENCHAEHSEASRLDFNKLKPRFLLPVVVSSPYLTCTLMVLEDRDPHISFIRNARIPGRSGVLGIRKNPA